MRGRFLPTAFTLPLLCSVAMGGAQSYQMTPFNVGNESGASFFWIHEATGCGGMCGDKLWKYDASSSSSFVWNLNDLDNSMGLSVGDTITGGVGVIALDGQDGNPDAILTISMVSFTVGGQEGATGRWIIGGGFSFELRNASTNALIQSGTASFDPVDLAGFNNTAWIDGGQLP